ncbi:gliding motility-associated C-terminal domain-containing protein [Weeksellaceae bacterium A-14]
MMKKYTFFFLLFSFVAGFSQTTNTLIQDGSGQLLPDVVTYCPGKSFDLKVDAKSSSTESYSITEVSSFIIASGAQPVPFTDKTGNNKFSSPIEIGFPFEFFGKTYTQVVVGSNGRLVFGDSQSLEKLHDSSLYIDRLFSGNNGSQNIKLPSVDYNKVYSSDPNKTLSLAQIFAGYTDLSYYNSTDYDKIKYSKTTYSGKKGLLISFSNVVEITGNYSNTLSSQILLLEDNTYYIKIITKKDKQNAILGAQNETGTKAIWPVNNAADSPYNNGKWKSEGIAWVFKANLKPVSKIEWFVDGNTTPVGNGSQISFKPENSQNLKVVISYQDGTTAESTVNFSPYVKPEISSVAQTGCAAGEKLQVENPVSGITYYWYKDGKAYGTTGTSVIANATGKYTVKPDDCNAAVSDEIAISVKSDIVPIGFEDNTTFSKCDNENAASKTFRLTDLVGYQPGNGYTVQFLDENGSVVASAANDYQYTVLSGTPVTLTLKVSSTASDCSDSKKFVIDYLSFPQKNSVITAPKLCYGTDSYTLEQFKTDFLKYKDFDITFPSSVNPQTDNPVNVILKKNGYDCQATVHLNFDFYGKIEVKTYSQFPDHCWSSNEYFDLNKTKSELEYDDVKATFYTAYDASTKIFSDQITNLNYRGSGTVYVKLENSHGCLYLGDPPTLELSIYKPPTLIKTGPEIKYSDCGASVFDLTTNIVDYIGNWNHYSEIRYYDQSDTRLSPSEWESYNPEIKGQPYMVFVYNETDNLQCSDTIQFNLIKKEKPTVLKDTIMICGEMVYPLEQLKRQLVANPSLYTFMDNNEKELNSDIQIGDLIEDVLNIKIKDKNTGCISDPITIKFYKGNTTPLTNNETTVEICDDDFDGSTTLNLADYLTDLTSDTYASVLYFSDENLNSEISSPSSFPVSNGQTVYLKIQSSDYCSSIGKITFTVNTPTKSSTLQDKYYICYEDNVIVNAESENVSFDWDGGVEGSSPHERIFTEAGSYSVTLTNANGCSYTHSFEISADHQPVIKQINQDNDRIEVIAEGGSGSYQYSFDDGETWQQSNIYRNPTKDTYTIQVRSVFTDENGENTYCNGAPKSIYTIRISNVITPNGDGKNDTWIIRNLRKMSQISVIISDRYGRAVYSDESGSDYTTDPGNRTSSGNSDDFVWDGKVNGRPLSTGTYWYIVKWYDPASLKNEVRTGWILLKNRE